MRELRFFFVYVVIHALFLAILPLLIVMNFCATITTPALAFIKRRWPELLDKYGFQEEE